MTPWSVHESELRGVFMGSKSGPPVVYFTKDIKQSLTKPPVKSYGGYLTFV